MKLERLEGQEKAELSMVEVAYEIMAESNKAFEFNDLLAAVQEYMGFDDSELADRMAGFYTELNSDGSFISLGENRWGLRAWYPVDAINEAIVNTVDDDELRAKHKGRRRKKKVNYFASSEDDDIPDYSDDDPEDHDEYEEYEDYEDDYSGDENSDDELENYQEDLHSLSDDDEDLNDDLDEEDAGETLEDGLEGDLSSLRDEAMSAKDDESYD